MPTAIRPIRIGPRTRSLIAGPLLVALAACDHSAPVAAPDNGSNQPFDSTRVTISPTNDLGPAWRLDGPGILYSYETVDSERLDRCLGLLPPSGGRLTWRLCDGYGNSRDSTDAYEWPAPHRDGRVTFVHLRGSNFTIPISGGIRLADLHDPSVNRLVTSFPILGDSGQVYPSASQLHWLGADRIVFAAENLWLTPTGWIATGKRLMLLDVNGGTPIPLPDTDYGSSVIPGGTDTLYFTRAGSAGLFRHILSTGTTTQVHTFSGGIARDLIQVGRRIAAVVGGNIDFITDQAVAPIQADSGGYLVLFDPEAGTETAVDLGGMLIRRPALAPGGTRLVVERHGQDSVPAPQVDLWLAELP
jgi:hypothetical protein